MTTSYPSAGTPTITATYRNSDRNYNGSSGSLTQTILAPGVTSSGTTVYIVSASTKSESASVTPAGTSNTGSTGVAVTYTINGASSTKTIPGPLTTIVLAGYAGNETFTLAPTLTLAVTITAGDGNDTVQLGAGNSMVSLGNGNDKVSGGDGNDAVTLGAGNDAVTLGGGNNTVTLGAGDDTILLGNGSNVVVEGNGHDSVTIGNGNNFVVGGLGPHTITAGNGKNILIDGSATVNNPGDSFRQILNGWAANPVASNQAAIRQRFTVNYNAKYANTLTAGSGIDWFFYQPPTTSNKKPTDFLN